MKRAGAVAFLAAPLLAANQSSKLCSLSGTHKPFVVLRRIPALDSGIFKGRQLLGHDPGRVRWTGIEVRSRRIYTRGGNEGTVAVVRGRPLVLCGST